MKIAIFLPNWIGDVVMATPCLRAVRRGFIDAEIVAVHRPYIGELLNGLELFDRSLVYDPRGKDPDRRGRRFLSHLRGEKIDWAIMLPNSLRTAWMGYMSGAKRRVGINRDGRGIFLTDALPPKPKSEPHPVIDEYLRIARHLGCANLKRSTELALTADDCSTLEQFWNSHDSRLRTRRLVCLNPGGAFGAAKHWPAASFAHLAKRLADEQNATVLVLCGPSEREVATEIVNQASHPHVVSLASMPPGIGLTKAAVASADLLVTTDSGPRHFAQPFGVPVVTLFGPTHIAWSETYYARARHVQLVVDCGPCQKRVCPFEHHRCMRDLSADSVYDEAAAMLQKYPRRVDRLAS